MGRKATSASPEGKILYEYDVLGRMNLKKWSGSQCTPQSCGDYENITQYAYDSLGRLQTVSQLRLGGVNLAQADQTSYAYDILGNLSQMRYDNGLIEQYQYDSLNRLDVLTHWVDDDVDGDGNGQIELAEKGTQKGTQKKGTQDRKKGTQKKGTQDRQCKP